jgi:uncharacterized membrane protein
MGAGKYVLFLILSHIATNGFWIFYNIVPTDEDSPIIIFPVISVICLIIMIIGWVVVNWDTKL